MTPRAARTPQPSRNDGDGRIASLAVEPTRRRLTERQAEVVDALIEAAADEVEQTGYAGLTVRNVARRAGVAPATAYTYFSSKDHLLAELLWRRIVASAGAGAPGTASTPDGGTSGPDSAGQRIGEAVRSLGTVTTESPAVAAACTPALLGTSPDVKELRVRIGTEVARRLSEALGEPHDAGLVRILVTVYFGALLTAGMGHMSYAEVPELVVDAALRLGGHPGTVSHPGNDSQPDIDGRPGALP